MTTLEIEQIVSNSRPFILTKKLPEIAKMSQMEKQKLLSNPKNLKYIQNKNEDLSAALIQLIDSKFKNIVRIYDNNYGTDIFNKGFTSYEVLIKCAHGVLEIAETLLERLTIQLMKLIKIESKLSVSDIISKNMKYSDIESELVLARINQKDTRDILIELDKNRTVQSITIDIVVLYGITLEIKTIINTN